MYFFLADSGVAVLAFAIKAANPGEAGEAWEAWEAKEEEEEEESVVPAVAPAVGSFLYPAGGTRRKRSLEAAITLAASVRG